jgi:hypothetical protein
MDLQTRARLAEATLGLAVFGFNPGQRRGPDGRWIKMGGGGSAGKSAPAVGRAPRPKGGKTAKPRSNPRMEKLDQRIADTEAILNEPGEDYLRERRQTELDLNKKARATFGDPLPGESDADHEARVLSNIKGATALMDAARAAGWQTAASHQTDNSGMPFVTVAVRNPDTGEVFETTWHTRKNGTYQQFGQGSMVTRVGLAGPVNGRRYGSTRPPSKLREIMAQEPAGQAEVRDGLSAALEKAAAQATPDPAPVAKPQAEAAAVEPPIGPDGKYVKPVKQVAVWNGQVATRTSRTPYRYASVVQHPGRDEPTIVSWHKTADAAQRGTLTPLQRKGGARVVGVAEARPEAPGQSAMDSWERKRLDDLEATARERHGPDESQWPAALRKNIQGLRKQRDAATMSRMAASDVFRMPGDLADYWIRGEGAAKIRWCTEGAFERARRALREHVPEHMLDGTVANLYKRACGKWPGQGHD